MVAPNGVVMGAGIFAVGFAVFRWSYDITRFFEQLDAIGSKRSFSEVEPADWNVSITAGLGAGVMLVGATVFVLALVSQPA